MLYNQNPLFVNLAGGNLRLQACSPVLNVGDNTANSTTTDLDGSNRKFGVIDMGAYEYQSVLQLQIEITSVNSTPIICQNDGTITAVGSTPCQLVGTVTYSINGVGGNTANTTGVFSGLPSGNYTVTVGAGPTGYTASPADQGGDDAVDSDGTAPVNVTLPFNNSQDLTIDFGFVTASPNAVGIGNLVFLDANGKVIPGGSTSTHLAVGVPGTVAGLDLALRKYGTMKLKDVIEPSIKIAEQGFVVSSHLESLLTASQGQLGRWPSSRAIFFKGDRPLRAGE